MKKEIDALQQELIRKNIQSALFDSINRYYYAPESIISSEIDTPKPVLMALKACVDCIKKAPGIFEAGDAAKAEAARAIEGHAAQIRASYKKLVQYIKRLEFLKELLEYGSMFSEYGAELAETLIPRQFVMSCREYVEGEASEFRRRVRMSKIMRCLPMRYTRGKYEEYFEKSARLMFPGVPRAFLELFFSNIHTEVDLFKLTFDNGEFMRIAGELNRISREALLAEDNGLAPVGAPLDGAARFEELHDELHAVSHMMRQSKEAMSAVFAMANAVTALLVYAPDLEYAFGGDIVLKDVFYLLAEDNNGRGEPYGSDEDDIFRESIRDSFEDALARLEDELGAGYDEYRAVLERYGDELPRRYRPLQRVLCAVEDLLSGELTEAGGPDELRGADRGDVADEGFIRQKLREFNDKFSEIDREQLIRRKFIKSRILSSFPYPYDSGEFYAYLTDSVNENSSGAQRFITAFRVAGLLEDEGFYAADGRRYD